MQQVCAGCKGKDVFVKSAARSDDRVSRYECRGCGHEFWAKRPTRRARKEVREEQEFMDEVAMLIVFNEYDAWRTENHDSVLLFDFVIGAYQIARVIANARTKFMRSEYD